MGFGYFILLLGGLIFFHELGHFLVARWCGVRVLVFSLGFGPRWTVYRSKKTGTEYCVSLLPLGGYVKMLGDDPDEPLPEADRAQAFSAQPLWKRSAIVAAGPIFNLILPLFLFFGLAFGEDVHPALVGLVMPDGPAAQAGMKPGDRIVEIEGQPIQYWWQLQDHIAPSAGLPLDVGVERGGERVDLVITPASFREVRYAEIGAVDERGQIRVAQYYVKPWIHVAADSPAEAAGLRSWDRIIAVDGQEVDAWFEVEHRLRARRGHDVAITAVRAEGTETLGGVQIAPPTRVVQAIVAVPAAGLATDFAPTLGLDSSEMYVYAIEPDSQSAELGLQVGDRLETLDGEILAGWSFFGRRLHQDPEAEHELVFSRDGERHSVRFVPRIVTEKGELNTDVKRLAFGVTNFTEYGAPDAIENDMVWSYAFRQAFHETWDKTKLNVLAVAGLFSGKVPMKDLGGPILIGQLAAKTEQYGWRYFFQIMVMLSINLGLLNLLPIPVLDGGHLFMFAIEGLRRKPLSQRWRQGMMYVGLAFIVVLMVVVFKNDLERSWSDIVDAFR